MHGVISLIDVAVVRIVNQSMSLFVHILRIYCLHASKSNVLVYSKTCLKEPLKIDKTEVLKTYGSLMKV